MTPEPPSTQNANSENICGCNILNLKNFNRKIKTKSLDDVIDPGHTINIGVVIHIITVTGELENEDEKIVIEMEKLQKAYNMNPDNFNNGQDVYAGTQWEDLYTDYVSRSGNTNFNFYLEDVTRAPFRPFLFINDIYEWLLEAQAISPPIQPRKYLNVGIFNGDVGGYGIALNPALFNPEGGEPMAFSNAEGFGVVTSTSLLAPQTTIHEAGHVFGLDHSFVNSLNPEIIEYYRENTPPDVPLQGLQTVRIEVFPYFNTNEWPSSELEGELVRNLFMQYMDFSNYVTQFMFTQGQIERMRRIIIEYAPEMAMNPGPTPPPRPPFYCCKPPHPCFPCCQPKTKSNSFPWEC